MRAENLVAHLERVKRTGPNRWVALCPAHDDHHPSLAIQETDDGRTLLRCRTGCATYDVLAAVGLELHDLFPEKIVPYAKPNPNPWRASDLLHLIDQESLVILIVAADMIEGRTIDEAAFARVRRARTRLAGVVGVLPC